MATRGAAEELGEVVLQTIGELRREHRGEKLPVIGSSERSACTWQIKARARIEMMIAGWGGAFGFCEQECTAATFSSLGDQQIVTIFDCFSISGPWPAACGRRVACATRAGQKRSGACGAAQRVGIALLSHGSMVSMRRFSHECSSFGLLETQLCRSIGPFCSPLVCRASVCCSGARGFIRSEFRWFGWRVSASSAES